MPLSAEHTADHTLLNLYMKVCIVPVDQVQTAQVYRQMS